MKSRLFIFNLILFTLIFSSCSRFLTPDHIGRVKTENPSTKVKMYNSQGSLKSIENTVDSTTFEYLFGNQSPYYIFEQEHDSFYTHSEIIVPSRYNPVMYVTYSIPVVIGGLILLAPEVSALITVFSLTSSYALLDVIGGVHRIYEKEYVLEGLKPYPAKTKEHYNLNIDQIDLKIKPKDYSWQFYSSIKDYRRDYYSFKSSKSDSIFVEKTNLQKDLNLFLSKRNLRDSTRFLSGFNRSEIQCDILKVKEYKVSTTMKYEVTCQWKFNDLLNVGNSFDVEKTAVSKWIFDDNAVHELRRELVLDACIKTLGEILHTEQMQCYLESISDTNDIINKYEDLFITNNSANQDVPDAVKSCVTIQTDHGHGSGCLISGDGYIVTNHHVLEKSINEGDSIVEIILEDGSKLDGHILRHNPFYDLALVKVDTVNMNHFKIDPKRIAVGEEVFAIGTPEDVELGQTLSKGIISGKRKVDDILFYQTDVSINQGNSGGAMIDKSGNLIGIVSYKMIGLTVEGIGFSIPVEYLNDALNIKF